MTVPVFGIRHQATRAKDARDTTDLGHLVGGCDGGVEIGPATLDAGDQVIAADHVGAGRFGLRRLVANGEDDHAGGLAGAVRQVDGATDHLVGLAGVDTQQ